MLQAIDKIPLLDHVRRFEELSAEGERWVGTHQHGDSKGKRCMHIYPKTNTWSCFHCQTGGGLLQYEMARLGTDKRGGFNSLREQYPALHGNISDEQIANIAKANETRDLMLEIFKGYADSHTSASMDYLLGRGLTEQTIKENLIGFAKGPVKVDATRDELLATGLFHEDLTPYYHQRVVFPYFRYGVPVYSIGRLITSESKKKYLKQLLHNDQRPWVDAQAVQNCLYNEEAIGEGREIVCVEGILDAILLRQEFPDMHVTSPVTNTWPNEVISDLQSKVGLCKSVVFIPDSEQNESGLSGAIRTAIKLDASKTEEGPEIRIARLRRPPERSKVDVADYIRYGHSKDLLYWIKAAVPLEYEMARQQNDGSRFLSKRFVPKRVADELKLLGNFYATRNGEFMKYGGGYYQPAENETHLEIIDLMGEAYTPTKGDNVLTTLKRSELVKDSEFDKHAYQVNCKNGIYDVETGAVIPHSAFRYDTKQANVEIGIATDADKFEITEFIGELVAVEDIQMIYELIGYCLCNSAELGKAWVFLGKGANGKSTLTDLIGVLCGQDNYSSVSLQAICDDKFAASQLQGKYANLYSDLPATPLKDTDIFNMLATGNPTEVQRKFQQSWKLKNTATMVFAANVFPKSWNRTEGFKRRFIMIDFPADFSEGGDPQKLKKLSTPGCLSALFTFAMSGIREVLKNEVFTISEGSRALTQEVAMDNDPALEFVSERIVLAAEAYVTYPDLKDEYAVYLETEPDRVKRGQMQHLISTIKNQFPDAVSGRLDSHTRIMKGVELT